MANMFYTYWQFNWYTDAPRVGEGKFNGDISTWDVRTLSLKPL